jgi:hypothetical protein
MKKVIGSLILVTIFSIATFAADAGKGTVQLPSTVKVAGTELPAGSYKVTWTGTGDNAQVTLKQGNHEVTTTAQVVSQKRSQNAVVTKSENGTQVLSQIQFRDQTLVLNETPASVAGR